jgi:hypothetical protein
MIPAIALWVLAASVQMPSSAKADNLDAQFLGLETKVRTAIKQKDVPALDAILAKEFGYRLAIAGGPPQVMSRPEWLKAGSYYTLEDFEIQNLVARRFGDVVVVDFTFLATASLGARDRSGEFSNTDVWVRDGGAWKLAARYASRPDTLAPAKK